MGLTAFVFPGQGSQSVGMGKDMYHTSPSIRALYETAGTILGYDLAGVSFDGPEERLKETQYTQPALFVHSAAVCLLLRENGADAQAAAGHSLGEFSALAFAGAFTFEEGLRLVHARSRLMQEAATHNPGSMAALIGLDVEDIQHLCEEASRAGLVQPANFNSPGQVVISGTLSGVETAIRLAKERGAKRALQLPVSGAFHSPLMQSAAEEMEAVLTQVPLKQTRIPVYANVTAAATSSADEIRSLLNRQLVHPVRWIETVQNMIQAGVTRFVEVGPGKVLSGLIRRIDPNVEILNCGTVEEITAMGNGQSAIGDRLWAIGYGWDPAPRTQNQVP